MAFDKFLSKAKNLANDPKVREKLNSEKVGRLSDQVLNKAAGAADSLTKGKYSDKIKSARDAADRAMGSDGRRANPNSDAPYPGSAPGTPRPGEAPRSDFDRDRPQNNRVDAPREDTPQQPDPNRRDRPQAP